MLVEPYAPNIVRVSISLLKFFNGSTPGVGVTFETPDGETLLRMGGWQMSAPNYKNGNANILYDRRPSGRPFYRVGASFNSPKDEHFICGC